MMGLDVKKTKLKAYVLNNKDLAANRKNLYIGTRKNHSPLGQSLFAPAVFERDQMMEDTL